MTGNINMKQVNEYQEEVLNILQEECAEVIQAASKIKRFGLIGKRGDDITNLDSLEMEIGDVLTLIEMLIESDIGITHENINAARANKRVRLSKYMHTRPKNPQGELNV